MSRALPNVPGAIIGYRRNGTPIRLIAGGDGEGDQGKPDHTKLTYRQAVNRLKDIKDEMQRVQNKETRTAEDDRNWANWVQEARALDEHIRKLKRDADEARLQKALDDNNVEPGDGHVDPDDRYADVADRTLNPDSVRHRRFRDPYDLSEMRAGLTDEEQGAEFRARALSAIEAKRFITGPCTESRGTKPDTYREACARIIEEHDDEKGTLSQKLLRTSREEYVKAFGKYVAARGNMAVLDHDEARAVAVGTITTGGALLPFQLDPAVVLTADGSFNQVRRAARQVVAIGDKWHAVTSGGVTSRWAGEATPANDDSPTFQRPEVDIHKLDIFVPISVEAAMDLINVAQEIARLIAFEADRRESVAFVTGTGTGQPAGFVTRLAAAGAPVLVETAATGVFAEEDVYTIDGALPERHSFNGSWFAHRRVYNDVRQFDEAGGSALWVQLGQGLPPELLGRPAYRAEAMDADSTVNGANILAYGDYQNFVVADRIGTTVEFMPLLVDPTAGAAPAPPTGQRGWYAFKRVGADSLNDGAFRLLAVNDGV